jgi:hypothetical protein
MGSTHTGNGAGGEPLKPVTGRTRIGAEGIRKHFSRMEPAGAVIELAWNGFDAKAKSVEVTLTFNDLETLSTVEIADDGDGVDFTRIKHNFGRFNESEKTGMAAMHGHHGRGRLAFDRLAHRAIWFTCFKGRAASISVTSADLESYEYVVYEDGQAPSLVPGKGTRVVLHPVTRSLPHTDAMLAALGLEFGWFLAVNPDARFTYDGRPVRAPPHDIVTRKIERDGHEFDISIVRWHDKPASEKSQLYLLDGRGTTVYHRLNAHNNKPGFFTSVIARSAWANGFAPEQDLLRPDAPTAASKTWRGVEDDIVAMLRDVYDDFQRAHVEQRLVEFEDEGAFPDFSRLAPVDAAWRRENLRSVLRAMMLAEPGVISSNRKQRLLFIRLVDRLSVAGENDALFDVLHSVLELDPPSVARLAAQLQRTTLDNIIQTISLLQERAEAVAYLRELMRTHYRTLRETPDLQRVIEQNTWLFGPQFATLGAEETTFTDIAHKLRLEARSADDIEQGDIEDVSLDVSLQQPDLFLVRRLEEVDSLGVQFFRWVIVEIKRPSIALNYRHLRQLEDYRRLVANHDAFTSEHVRVDLILIGRRISKDDSDIRTRLRERSKEGRPGLIQSDDRINLYVLNWETVLDGFEITHRDLLRRLRLKRESLEQHSKGDLLVALAPHATRALQGDAGTLPEARVTRGKGDRKKAVQQAPR